MDPNTQLLLAKTGEPVRWEDEEKTTNDIEALREEFRSRLYPSGMPKSQAENENAAPKVGAA